MKIFGKEVVAGDSPTHEKIDFKKSDLIFDYGFPADKMPENWRISYHTSNPLVLVFETADHKESVYLSYSNDNEVYEVRCSNYNLNKKDTGTKEFKEFKEASNYVIGQMKIKKSVKLTLSKFFGK